MSCVYIQNAWFPRFQGQERERNPSGTQRVLGMSLSYFFSSEVPYAQFVCIAYTGNWPLNVLIRESRQTLPGSEADIKVTWFQETGLQHEPFVCCWKFSAWISGWAVQFIEENVDTSCQRLFSLVPENGGHCVFGTHTKKANSDLIVSWEQKLLPGDKMGDPRLLLGLLCALQSRCCWEPRSKCLTCCWCLSVRLTHGLLPPRAYKWEEHGTFGRDQEPRP